MPGSRVGSAFHIGLRAIDDPEIGIEGALSTPGDPEALAFLDHPGVSNAMKEALMVRLTARIPGAAPPRGRLDLRLQCPARLRGNLHYYAADHALTPAQAAEIDTAQTTLFVMSAATTGAPPQPTAAPWPKPSPAPSSSPCPPSATSPGPSTPPPSASTSSRSSRRFSPAPDRRAAAETFRGVCSHDARSRRQWPGGSPDEREQTPRARSDGS